MMTIPPKFSGLTAFRYIEANKEKPGLTLPMNRKMLLEFLMGGRRNGGQVTMSKYPLELQDGDLLVVSSAGQKSHDFDQNLRHWLAAEGTPYVTGKSAVATAKKLFGLA